MARVSASPGKTITINFYDVDKNRIWSDDKTTVPRGAAKITARGGVETDSKLTKIELKKQSTRLPKTTRELQRKK